MKRLVYLWMMLFSLSITAQNVETLSKKVDSLSLVIDRQKAIIENFDMKMETLNDSYEKQGELFSTSNEVINTKLEAGNRSYNIFSSVIVGMGALFTVLAVGLGIFVRRKERNVNELLDKVRTAESDVENKSKEVAESLKTVEAAKKEVEKLNNQIHSDMSGLYEKLKREETVSILNRLIDVPRDICHFISSLLSRGLENEDFAALLKAYEKLVAIEENSFEDENECNYLLLFFQHFLDLSLNHETLKFKIREFFPDGCIAAFENDIIKSTNDLVKGIDKMKYHEKFDIMLNYIDAVDSYREDNLVVYDIIVNNINDKKLHLNIWNTLYNKPLLIANYGLSLQKNFSEDKKFIEKIDNDLKSLKGIFEDDNE